MRLQLQPCGLKRSLPACLKKRTEGFNVSNRLYLAKIVGRDIGALLEKQRQSEREKTRQDHVADAITRFAGSMRFVYVHLFIYGIWVIVNSGLLPIKRFDSNSVMLATLASVESIFLSTFILISQNRMRAQADKWADLDLQVVLLSEHEITRVLKLVRAMADRMGIEDAKDDEFAELEHDIQPEKVLDELEANQE